MAFKPLVFLLIFFIALLAVQEPEKQLY